MCWTVHSKDKIQRIKGKKHSFPVCFLKNSQSRLLSRSVSHGLGLLKFIEEVCKDVFRDFGLLKGESVRIQLRPEAHLYNLATPLHISAPLLALLKEKLERMETNEIVTRVTTAIELCSLFTVKNFMNSLSLRILSMN